MSLLVCASCSTRYADGLEACPHCRSTERVKEGGGGSRLPYLDVVCPTVGCRADVTVRRVYLRTAAPGVVEMPPCGCAVCGAPMAVVSTWRTPPLMKEERDMPKVTVHGGASNRHEDVPEPPAEPVAQDEEEPSPGSSSETSPEKPPTSPETSESVPPKPARTTASRSKRARAGSSTAGSTDTSTEADGASENE